MVITTCKRMLGNHTKIPNIADNTKNKNEKPKETQGVIFLNGI